ncbi:hypothetical protein KFE25_012573 [Diacronema lutheri]|uniref:Thioredoxin domain-containing protein n=2 Tax=Diacronema lutheri TaxID=2081491 RepID=A0A8J5XMB3_DIALT|nr:hypothetical protein KFE25_012573 [Diacronema lutheri]
MASASPRDEAAFNEAVRVREATVAYFRADWCEPCAQLDAVFDQLAADHAASCAFVRVDAEELMAVSERYGVDALPAVVVLREGKEAGRLGGVTAPALVELVAKLAAEAEAAKVAPLPASAPPTASPPSSASLDDRLKALVSSAPTMLFMKGSPDAPRCGFSRQIVELLRAEGVPFGHFDILADEDVRHGLKAFSNWPTYPQLYAGGKLVGGLDIVRELKEEGELKDALAS